MITKRLQSVKIKNYENVIIIIGKIYIVFECYSEDDVCVEEPVAERTVVQSSIRYNCNVSCC